jgi:hypothetical protein
MQNSTVWTSACLDATTPTLSSYNSMFLSVVTLGLGAIWWQMLYYQINKQPISLALAILMQVSWVGGLGMLCAKG